MSSSFTLARYPWRTTVTVFRTTIASVVGTIAAVLCIFVGVAIDFYYDFVDGSFVPIMAVTLVIAFVVDVVGTAMVVRVSDPPIVTTAVSVAAGWTVAGTIVGGADDFATPVAARFVIGATVLAVLVSTTRPRHDPSDHGS